MSANFHLKKLLNGSECASALMYFLQVWRRNHRQFLVSEAEHKNLCQVFTLFDSEFKIELRFDEIGEHVQNKLLCLFLVFKSLIN